MSASLIARSGLTSTVAARKVRSPGMREWGRGFAGAGPARAGEWDPLALRPSVAGAERPLPSASARPARTRLSLPTLHANVEPVP